MRLLRPLGHGQFLGLWTAYTLSIAATTVLPTILALMILDWQTGIGDLGIALSSRTAGFLVGALLGGQIADRFPRHAVIAFASLSRGLAVIFIALFFGRDITLIALCLFIAGAGEGAFRSAYQSVLVEVLEQDLLQQANALTTLSARILQTGGPLAAVAVYSLFGAATALLIAGSLWVSGALLIVIMWRTFSTISPEEEHYGGSSAGFWTSYRDGLREALRHHWFLAGLAALLVWLALGNSVQQLLLPVISRDLLGGNTFMGLALSSYAAGALIGALYLGSTKAQPLGCIAFIGLALYGLVPLALASGENWFILAAYFLGGLGIELFNIPWFTTIQSRIPRDLLGRISSIDFLVSYGISPLALAGLPSITLAVGRTEVLIVAGVLVIFAPLACWILLITSEFRRTQKTQDKS
ncbi:MFS transporter [Rhizobium oryzicola]|uniref:MFS transporter n=1 Tax=Rhizobium oryzicola TaxID=1232668 RepID=A0ABT8SVW0_9HYPH|nr:MFS transporter [Rhizobium oryzicola]MDO1582570.1 MFS transporter [Rhizobium oryzicola]